MPAKSINGPESEKVWEKAVSAAGEQYGKGLKTTDPDRFYAIVMTIYKKMCTAHDCTPKAEDTTEALLWRLEMREELVESSMPRLGLPGNYREWELYPPDTAEEKKATAEAVREMNSSMRDAAKDIWGVIARADMYDEKKMAKAIATAYAKHVDKVLLKHKETGASDTEPRYIAAQKLIDFVKGHYGVKGWTRLGDYI